MSADSATTPFVVINPAAGRGRGAGVGRAFIAALRATGDLDSAATTARGDERRLVRDAHAAGHRVIVAVGGDGTWSHVADAAMRLDPRPVLGFVPGGTGSDFARSLGLPRRDPARCAAVVRAGKRLTVDVGRIEDRYFLNIAGFGYDVSVLERSWAVNWLPGGLVYLYCAVRQLFSYPGFEAEIGSGDDLDRRELLMLIAANAREFGGGLRIAPEARLDDGRLDCVVFGNMGAPGRLLALVRLLRGTHVRPPAVQSHRQPCLRLRFAAPPAYEVDGEWCRAASPTLEVTSVPAALEVLVP